MEQSLRTVSVIGLGKLGAPMAACFAARGYNTIGVDTNARNIEAIQQGVAPVDETDLQKYLDASEDRLRATLDLEQGTLESDASFIIVPTPSEPGGGFSLKYVLAVCEKIGQALQSKAHFHLVVVTSTVMPGSMDGPIRHSLEKNSGKQCGKDFGLCYSPEFIALGNVIHDFLNPDFFLIGESDPRSGELLEQFYHSISENDAPVARMNFVNAELTKISINTFVTTKITFANMLGHLCERLPDGNVDVVTAAVGMDSRIGRKYLKGAIGYGGPCFPRDNLALGTLARQLGTSAPLAEVTDQCNRQEITYLVHLVKQTLPQEGKIGILGLSYKPNTGVIEEAQGMLLAQALRDEGISVIAYDPMAMPNARPLADEHFVLAESVEQCIQQSDVLVITTPWKDFYQITPEDVTRPNAPRVIIDCWRILPQSQFSAVVHYIGVGIGPNT